MPPLENVRSCLLSAFAAPNATTKARIAARAAWVRGSATRNRRKNKWVTSNIAAVRKAIAGHLPQEALPVGGPELLDLPVAQQQHLLANHQWAETFQQLQQWQAQQAGDGARMDS